MFPVQPSFCGEVYTLEFVSRFRVLCAHTEMQMFKENRKVKFQSDQGYKGNFPEQVAI